jgi:small subunit ribosomal protein S20
MVRKYRPCRLVYLGKLGFLLVFSWIGLTFAVLNLEFMANHKATKKDVRQANKRRDRNRYYGKTTRNAIRDLRAIKGGKEAGEQLPEVASMIDKLAKKGVIHKNKAANLKSKLARKVNTLNIAK